MSKRTKAKILGLYGLFCVVAIPLSVIFSGKISMVYLLSDVCFCTYMYIHENRTSALWSMVLDAVGLFFVGNVARLVCLWRLCIWVSVGVSKFAEWRSQ